MLVGDTATKRQHPLGSMERRAIYGVQLKDKKLSTDLMFMQGLKETIDQLAMANIGMDMC